MTDSQYKSASCGKFDDVVGRKFSLSDFAVLVYPANIIDYVRILFLWLAMGGFNDCNCFAVIYGFSYFLDCFDGIVARALNQCSKLGYYLDMIIDRISSILALYIAATVLQNGEFVMSGPLQYSPISENTLSFILLFCALSVEFVSHAVVCYFSEVVGVHQKLLGFDYAVVRMYLESKIGLAFGCFSYEGLSIGIISNSPGLVFISLPGFIFRAIANLTRLYAVFTMKMNNTIRKSKAT
eukprot:GSMAST32.ASY1.ANO1.895.1 assembled CDS